MEFKLFGQTPVLAWNKENVQLAVLKVHDHYCGYAIFPKPFLYETGYSGLVTYVPVHGGVTLAEKLDSGEMVYGFDCAHAGDEYNPEVSDPDWLKAETERMLTGLLLAAKYETRYRTASGRDRAEVIQEYHNELETLGIAFNLTDNLGAMLNFLFRGF